MKEISSISPFAALSSKEQLERWSCWHSQRMREEPTAHMQESVFDDCTSLQRDFFNDIYCNGVH